MFLVVEKTLKTVEALHQSLRRRRNKRRIAGTSSADPVLRPAGFARCSVGPTPPAQQDDVNLAYESEREREGSRPQSDEAHVASRRRSSRLPRHRQAERLVLRHFQTAIDPKTTIAFLRSVTTTALPSGYTGK